MTGAQADDLRLVCFFLQGRELGVDIRAVKETMVLRPITRVFLTPDWVAGIINLRGDVVAVIDLARFLGLSRTRPSQDTRIIVMRGEGKTAGLLVDRLGDVRSVAPTAIQPTPSGAGNGEPGADLVRGVATVGDDARPLAVLDLERLWNSERIKQFERRVNGG